MFVEDFFGEYWPWVLTVAIILLVIIILLLLRRYIHGRKCGSKARLDGKTAIVTGSNIGIGKETARDFYKRGAKVILACRNLTKATEAARDIESTPGDDNGTVIIRRLDLCDFSSVVAFAKDFLTMETRLDILVNNAGLMAPKETTVDGFDMIFQANHLGHFLLTNLLLDRIKESAPARIVNVSSSGHQWGEMNWDDLNLNAEGAYGPWSSYCMSKLANVLFTKELAKRLQGTGVHTYTLHPGAVQTGFQRNNSVFFPACVTSCFSAVMTLFFKDAKEGAQTSIHCAVCEKAAHQTGLYYDDCRPKLPHKRSRDVASAKILWQISAEMVKLDAELEAMNNKINIDPDGFSRL